MTDNGEDAPDFDALCKACEEGRETLDHQIASLRNIDDKAIRILRANILSKNQAGKTLPQGATQAEGRVALTRAKLSFAHQRLEISEDAVGRGYARRH